LSIKDELEYVKKELSSDEKLLENAFKLERFYKKHKIKIWAGLILLIGGFGGKAAITAYKEHKLNIANEALLKLEANPKDSQALEELKNNNPKLYNLYLYSKALKEKDSKALKTLANSDDKILMDLAHYHINILNNTPGDSNYYKDLSKIEKAYESLKKGEKTKAREILALIDVNSPLSNIANLLKHLTLTK